MKKPYLLAISILVPFSVFFGIYCIFNFPLGLAPFVTNTVGILYIFYLGIKANEMMK